MNAGEAVATSNGPIIHLETLSQIHSNVKMASAVAQQIAGGHAWSKHRWDFPEFSTVAKFAEHIDDVMSNPSVSKTLAKGRNAFWHQLSRTVVIRDPNSHDLGTAFRPKAGKTYFDNLK